MAKESWMVGGRGGLGGGRDLVLGLYGWRGWNIWNGFMIMMTTMFWFIAC